MEAQGIESRLRLHHDVAPGRKMWAEPYPPAKRAVEAPYQRGPASSNPRLRASLTRTFASSACINGVETLTGDENRNARQVALVARLYRICPAIAESRQKVPAYYGIRAQVGCFAPLRVLYGAHVSNHVGRPPYLEVSDFYIRHPDITRCIEEDNGSRAQACALNDGLDHVSACVDMARGEDENETRPEGRCRQRSAEVVGRHLMVA